MCPFCTDPGSSGEVVYADDAAMVIVHPDRAVRGHLMIVSRLHVENPSQMPAEAWGRFAAVWHRAESALLGLTGCGRSIAMKLGIMTPHLHVHLYPFADQVTREEVFAAIDGKTSTPEDRPLAQALREAMAAKS